MEALAAVVAAGAAVEAVHTITPVVQEMAMAVLAEILVMVKAVVLAVAAQRMVLTDLQDNLAVAGAEQQMHTATVVVAVLEDLLIVFLAEVVAVVEDRITG